MYCRLQHITLVFGLALCSLHCDDAFIDPFRNTDQFYTIYGYLDESKNFEAGYQHRVRIIPVTRQPERIESPFDNQSGIDAEVYTIDLETSRVVPWTHSLEQLEDGSYGHVFSANLFVQSNHRYQLQIVRSDGLITRAITKVPAVGSILPVESLPYFTETGAIAQDFEIPTVESPWDIAIYYYHSSALPCQQATRSRVAYGRVGVSEADGWHFTAQIARDAELLTDSLGLEGFNLCAMGLELKVLDNQWIPPEDIFDPEVLVEPGALSNVENGLGFFGSIGVLRHDWPISDTLASLFNGAPNSPFALEDL